MQTRPSIIHELSYAPSVTGAAAQAFVRFVENVSGRLGLVKRADGYQDEIAGGRDFWQIMMDSFALELGVIGGTLTSIPRTGPLIVVSNHPFGILDGLILGKILSEARADFRILANSVFGASEELDKIILPINFDETREASVQNLETRKTALDYLRAGGAIGVFPGGTVSTSLKPFGLPVDPLWRTFTAKMISKSGATVVPVFFEGQNSRGFQICSHLSSTLRVALLINEFKRRTDTKVRIVVGKPLAHHALETYHSDPRAMMDFLRAETYSLSPKPLKTLDYGFDFEKAYKT